MAALVGLASQGAGTDARAEIEYLDELSTQVTDLAVGGDALRDVVSRLSRIERPELVTVIDDLKEDIDLGLAFVAAEPPSPELATVRSLYRLALQQWSAGVTAFGDGILAAADNPGDATPTSTLANALASLRAGDDLFLELQAEIERPEVRDPVNTLRDVTLLPAEGEPIPLALAYTDAARNPNNGIALRPGLALSMIVSDPEWQLNPDNMVVMPATDQTTFSVVISNVGNLRSEEEQMTLTLSGPGDPVSVSQPIPALDPGGQTTIVYEPLGLTPGELYEVLAEILVVGPDTNLEDNLLQVVFMVNNE